MGFLVIFAVAGVGYVVAGHADRMPVTGSRIIIKVNAYSTPPCKNQTDQGLCPTHFAKQAAIQILNTSPDEHTCINGSRKYGNIGGGDGNDKFKTWKSIGRTDAQGHATIICPLGAYQLRLKSSPKKFPVSDGVDVNGPRQFTANDVVSVCAHSVAETVNCGDGVNDNGNATPTINLGTSRK